MLLMWRLCSFAIGIHLSNLFNVRRGEAGRKRDVWETGSCHLWHLDEIASEKSFSIKVFHNFHEILLINTAREVSWGFTIFCGGFSLAIYGVHICISYAQIITCCLNVATIHLTGMFEHSKSILMWFLVKIISSKWGEKDDSLWLMEGLRVICMWWLKVILCDYSLRLV